MFNFKDIISGKILKYFKPAMIYGIRHNGSILPDTRISNTVSIDHKENLDLNDNVFIGHYTLIDASNGVSIGEGCQITNYISILSHSSHNSIRYYGREYRKHKDLKGYVKGSVEIGAYTFIGPHSTILPNTKIGKGCMITAYSMVKGEFPDFSIISGNPAKVTGDTRTKDAEFLSGEEQLKGYYEEWAKK